ncbi:MAG TPA: bacteriohemerythrin [Patescibacteria group bacterium]|nr:bacteriohemerythrin [Patescibacteria group bacterium]
MSQLKWTDKLSIGVDLIDEQHKMLIQRLNDMSSAIEFNKGPNEIARTLSFLIDYTDFHFSEEEKHMEEQEYPGLEEHISKHEEFKTTLADLENDYREDGATNLLAHSLDTFLINWLVNHISGVDVRFGNFLKDKGVTLTG